MSSPLKNIFWKSNSVRKEHLRKKKFQTFKTILRISSGGGFFPLSFIKEKNPFSIILRNNMKIIEEV